MKDANYAPMYCALYPQLAEISRKHGYAMAVHGTLGRDMDLICIPWIEAPAEPEIIVKEITRTFHLKEVGLFDYAMHGRKRWLSGITGGKRVLVLT